MASNTVTSALYVMRRAEKLRDQEQSQSQDWRLVPKIKVVPFPEALCPWCGAAIRSQSVWFFKGNYVMFTLKRRADRLMMRSSGVHPNVGGSGLVCLGNAPDPTTALFLGINPASSYFGVAGNWQYRGDHWLRQEFDHACSVRQWECSCGACALALSELGKEEGE